MKQTSCDIIVEAIQQLHRVIFSNCSRVRSVLLVKHYFKNLSRKQGEIFQFYKK